MVMVEEIVRVEPQLFGARVQHTSIARKMELWRRIVDRVNAVGQLPRNREDIRKRWNDLRGKGTQDNPPLQQQQGPGAVEVGTRSRGRRPRNTEELGGLLCDRGRTGPEEPTLHEALSNTMGAYHHSQETMTTVLAKFQEIQRLQEEQYSGLREELRAINSTLGTIVGVLKEVLNTRRDTVALQGAPDTSMDDELPTTSAGTSGQEAPPQDHHTSTPPPAE
ncbi:hypothetical protein NDU88_006764 [Pleurodeles waltl]|uniref:Myb/SANT-like DNA-binding domain-containing protein n=1 Tax=Pleurodeles waltl TaxID=8319 RepID=A0AAV7QM43_PLEWA|nr:hypothetical protein NDU88_006764 [Pleurodeles waltl]